MFVEDDDTQISHLELVLMVGVVGCMLFATWELGHLMVDKWLRSWVRHNEYTNKRIILYGIAFFMSISSLISTSAFALKFRRFGRTVNRAFLWYGTLLLMTTISIFVFDCLPEVFAGFFGAGIFIVAIYILQKKFFTKERVTKIRLRKGECAQCSSKLQAESYFCGSCGERVGVKCDNCGRHSGLMDKYCSGCGKELAYPKCC